MKKAFTLAEVLITLAVIGVVAAIAIPTVLQNTQYSEYKVALKKEYSVISQVSSLLMNDNAGTFNGLFQSGMDMRDKYSNYLSYSKKCNGASGCWGTNDTVYLTGAVFQTSAWMNGHYGLVLNDGTFLLFDWRAQDCSNLAVWGPSPDGLGFCGDIFLDVNGAKGPNATGKDVFWIGIQRDGIFPMGAPGTSSAGDCTNPPSGNGTGCTAKYLKG